MKIKKMNGLFYLISVLMFVWISCGGSDTLGGKNVVEKAALEMFAKGKVLQKYPRFRNETAGEVVEIGKNKYELIFDFSRNGKANKKTVWVKFDSIQYLEIDGIIARKEKLPDELVGYHLGRVTGRYEVQGYVGYKLNMNLILPKDKTEWETTFNNDMRNRWDFLCYQIFNKYGKKDGAKK